MAEEALEVDVVEQEDLSGNEDVVEVQYVEDFDPENPTEEQQAALKAGWRPEGVPGKEARTSREFNMLQPFYDELHKLKQRDKQSQKANETLAKQLQEISEQSYNKALQDLKRQKAEAIENADGEAVLKIDEQIDEIKAKKSEVKEASGIGLKEVENLFASGKSAWEGANPWYSENEGLAAAADGYIAEYIRTNSNLPPVQSEEEFVERMDKMFLYVNDKIKKSFPEKFMQQNKRPAAVGAASRKPAAKGRKVSIDNITDPAYKQVAQTLFRQGGENGTAYKNYMSSLEKSGHFDN